MNEKMEAKLERVAEATFGFLGSSTAWTYIVIGFAVFYFFIYHFLLRYCLGIDIFNF